MTKTEQDESEQVKKKPLYKEPLVKIGVGIALCLLAYSVLTRICKSYLEKRVNAVHTKFKERVKPKKRVPLLGPSSPGNAMDEYNAIRYMCIPIFAWRNNAPETMPKTDHPYNYFNKNSILVIEHARTLTDTLTLEAEYERFQNPFFMSGAQRASAKELQIAQAFFEKYSVSLTRHIRAGVKREHLERKISLSTNKPFPDFDSETLSAAAQLLAIEASRERSPDSVRTVAVLLAFASDMEQLFLDADKALAQSVKKTAFNALELLLRKRLRAKDCRLLLKTLQGVSRMKGEDLLSVQDMKIATGFAQIAGIAGAPEIEGFASNYLDWGSFGRDPLNLAFAWLVYENISQQQRQLMDQPPSESLAEFASMSQDRANNFSSLNSSMCIHKSYYYEPLTFNTHQDLLRLAVAARLYQLKNKKWPAKITALQNYFPDPIPKDPYNNGQSHYLLTVKGGDLVLATIKPTPSLNPLLQLAVRIRAPAK